MLNWTLLKNWMTHTQLWGILVVIALISGLLMLDARQDKIDVELASALFRGEKVEISDVMRVRNLSGTLFSRDLREAGLTELDIQRLGGDEFRYFQLPKK